MPDRTAHLSNAPFCLVLRKQKLTSPDNIVSASPTDKTSNLIQSVFCLFPTRTSPVGHQGWNSTLSDAMASANFGLETISALDLEGDSTPFIE